MGFRRTRKIPFSAALWVMAVWLSAQGHAQQKVNLSVGAVTVVRVDGGVELVRRVASRGLPRRLAPGMQLGVGDRLRTGKAGRVVLRLPDEGLIEVQPGTLLEILRFENGIGEIFRLFIGKVRLKIRHLLGRPSKYEMQTPIATIGVRGTDLNILVEPDRTTTIQVFEGLATIRDIQRPSEEILVAADQQYTVHPLTPPEPPQSLGRLVSENFIREASAETGLETVLEPVERPTISRFLAFSDPHLDVLDNPAFASGLVKPSGRLYLFPTRTESYLKHKEFDLIPLMQEVDPQGLFAVDGRYLQGVSARLSYIRPLGKWTLGGVFEHRRIDESFQFKIRRRPAQQGQRPTTEQIGGDLFSPRLDLQARADRGMVLIARRVRNQTFAFSLDWTDSGGEIQTSYEVKPDGQLLLSEWTQSRFDNQNKRLVMGYRLQTEKMGSFALSYSYGLIDGKTDQKQHQFLGDPAPLARFSTRGHHQEWRLTWRKRWHRRLLMGLQVGAYYSDLDETARDFRSTDSDVEETFFSPYLAAGIGGSFWDGRLTYSLDYRFTSVEEKSMRRQVESSTLLDEEYSYRDDHSLHSWLQLQLPWRLFTGGGVTSLWSLGQLQAEYEPDSQGRRTDYEGRPRPPALRQDSADQFTQLGVSFGRRFSHRYFLEYLVSKTSSDQFRPTSHSLLFRLSF